MKHTKKTILGIAALGLGAVLLSSCTQSFCSATDQANMAYPYEQGVTVYLTQEQANELVTAGLPDGASAPELAIPGNTTVYKYIPFEYVDGKTEAKSYKAAKAQDFLVNTILTNAASTNYGFRAPSKWYFEQIDQFALEASIIEAAIDRGQIADDFASYTHYDFKMYEDGTKALTDIVKPDFLNSIKVGNTGDNANGALVVNPYTEYDYNGDKNGTPSDKINSLIFDKENNVGYSILRRFGEVKFSGYGDDGKTAIWANMSTWNEYLRSIDMDACPTDDFMAVYQSQVVAKVNANRSCIATSTKEGVFGHYGSNADWEVRVETKDWGYAWSKGFLEGLLVYPISWLTDTIAYGIDPALTGVGQIISIVLVTLIVRLIMMAATFKTTLSQQKMQALQPQLAKLQQKYPNSNTNQAEKQRLAQEQMALYKRNKINPMGQLIVLIFQFPIFICVWSALQGSAALSSGQFLNLRLSDTIQSVLFNTIGNGQAWYANINGWWTALVLFILMAATQFFAMLLPQLINKAKNKKITKLSKNPAQDKNNKQMKWITYGMLIFTIIMGFFLPSAMGVYWLIGGLISMMQTGITQLVLAKGKKH
ncbi:MAG: membrane protein insertase YidC [Bacilli bacterium]|nr:membrane protein insertase YidC [Bacilli bacterium]